MFNTGDKVKFTEKALPEKIEMNSGGWFLPFGKPVEVTSDSVYTVEYINDIGSDEFPDYEIKLKEFPALVYMDELTLVDDGFYPELAVFGIEE